jgi:protein involved in sex pheromone biosynthesis
VDLNYLLQRFNIDVPIDFNYTTETILLTVTPAPAEEGGEEGQ